MSNLKQLSLGVLQYSADFDDRLPYAVMVDGGMGTVAANTGFRWYWQDAVYPYVKSDGVYSCPDTMQGPTPGTGIGPYRAVPRSVPGGRHSTTYDGLVGSFIANATYWGGAPGTSPIPLTPDLNGFPLTPVVVASIQAPSATAMIMDGARVTPTAHTSAMWITWQYGISGGGPTLNTNSNGSYITGASGTVAGYGSANFPTDPASAVARHQGFIDVAFCDGHVKPMKPEVLMAKSKTNFLNGNPAQPAYSYWTVQQD